MLLNSVSLANSQAIDDVLNNQNLICPYKSYDSYSVNDLDELLFYKHLINGWLSVLVIVFGICANCVTIVVLVHKNMQKTSTNNYLLALSISNLFSLICLLLMSGLRFTVVHPYRLVYCKYWYESFVSVAIPYLTPINQSFQLSGIYLITAVSIDRYLLLKNPKRLARQKKKTSPTTWLIILSIYAFSLLFTLPNWLAFTSIPVWSNLTQIAPQTEMEDPARPPPHQVRHYITVHTTLGHDPLFKQLLNIWLYIPFVFIIPLAVLVLVNALITCELSKIKRRKRQLGNSASKLDRSITLMLVCIVLLFLLCQIPLLISHIIYVQFGPQVMFQRHFFLYNSFTNFLTCIYMSANFALFCVFGHTFRSTVRYMFCLRTNVPGFGHSTVRLSRPFDPELVRFSVVSAQCRASLKRRAEIARRSVHRRSSDKRKEENEEEELDGQSAKGIARRISFANECSKYKVQKSQKPSHSKTVFDEF